MYNQIEETQTGVFNEVQKPHFKPWMRIIALVVIFAFLYQDVVWAFGPNFGSLAAPQFIVNPVSQLKPEIFNKAIADAVYRFLKPLANKPVGRVQIKPGLIISKSHQPPVTSHQIKEIYKWLKRPETETVPCSAYVLYNLLRGIGKKVKVEELSALLILTDILSGNIAVPPASEQKEKTRIYNSIYSLSKTAEYFGLNLSPVKLPAASYQLSAIPTPFIAHLSPELKSTSTPEHQLKGHFVLVTKIDDEKVHYFYDKGNSFLPIEKFLEEFSGYALLQQSSYTLGQPVSEEVTKDILGAYSRKYDLPKFDDTFKDPSWGDIAISAAVTAASIYVGGGGLSGNFNWANAGQSFTQGAFTGTVGSALTTFGAREMHMSPAGAQVFGYAVSGVITGAMSTSSNHTWINTTGSSGFKNTAGGWMNNHSVLTGAIMGGLKGASVAGGSIMAYNAMKNTGFYKRNPSAGNQLASIAGGFAGYAGFSGTMGALGINLTVKAPVDEKNGKVWGRISSEDLQNSNGVEPGVVNGDSLGGYYDRDYVNLSADNFGGGFLGGIKLAWHDAKPSLIYQGTAAIVECALGEKFKYSRVLGESAGGLASAKTGGQNLWAAIGKGVLSGAVSAGLESIAGKYDEKTGKNKWGMTRLQTSSLEYLGSAVALSAVGAIGPDTFWGSFKKNTANTAIDYITWGRTSPVWTQGGGGWSEVQYMNKVAAWGGYADFKANADAAMKTYGYDSWRKFVKDGYLDSITPSLTNSWVRYTQDTLHYAAVDNISSALWPVVKGGIGALSILGLHRLGESNRKSAKGMGVRRTGIELEKGPKSIVELPKNSETEKPFADNNTYLDETLKQYEFPYLNNEDLGDIEENNTLPPIGYRKSDIAITTISNLTDKNPSPFGEVGEPGVVPFEKYGVPDSPDNYNATYTVKYGLLGWILSSFGYKPDHLGQSVAWRVKKNIKGWFDSTYIDSLFLFF